MHFLADHEFSYINPLTSLAAFIQTSESRETIINNKMMLKEKRQYGYETEEVDMTSTTLDSIVNNLGAKVGKMRVKIHLKEHQKQIFELQQLRAFEREDAVELLSDDDEEHPAARGKPAQKLKAEQARKTREAMDIRSIPVKFELSILLQERYTERLERIGRRLSVRFMVVPEKVKIMGLKEELVDEAEEEFVNIRDKIRFIPLEEGGREVFLSSIYKDILKQHELEVVKILNQYYVWYEEGVPDPTSVLRDIFNDTTHRLLHLHMPKEEQRYREVSDREKTQNAKVAHGPAIQKKSRTAVIFELQLQVKAILFEKYVGRRVNRLESKEKRKVELSDDRKSLIIHLDTKEQLDIQVRNVNEFYEQFEYTFLNFESAVEMREVEAFLEEFSSRGRKKAFSKKSQSEPRFYFKVMGYFACLAYLSEEEPQVEPKAEDHQILRMFREMPEEIRRFELAVQNLLEDPEDNPSFKKFAFQRDRVEKLTYIRLKNPSFKNYEFLLRFYIEDRFKELMKREEEKENMPADDVSQSVEVSLTRPIDETSIMVADSFDHSAIREKPQDNSMIKAVLPPELTNTQSQFKFEAYTFLIVDSPEERARRFGEVGKVKKKITSLSDPVIDGLIKAQAKFQLKLNALTVPLGLRVNLEEKVKEVLQKQPELAHFNREVTVFYGGKDKDDCENLYQDKGLKVLRLNDNKVIRQGYLLRTNVLLMFLQFREKRTVEMPLGTYQAQYFAKRLE